MTDPPEVIGQRYDPCIPLGDLREHPANPNDGDVGAVCESLDAHGFYGAVLVQESTGIVFAGNTRLRSARDKGMAGIPGFWCQVDDDTRDRILSVDNEATRKGRNDEERLVALLTGLAQQPRGLEGTGFDGEDLDALIATLGGPGGGGPGLNGDPDDVPEPPEEPVSVPGDLWRIGEHRLLVGDATDMAAVEKMLDGDRADCMWTDPPYGVDYQNFATVEQAKKARRRTDGLLVSNDKPRDLPDLLAGAFAVATAALKPGAAVYIAHPAGALCSVFLQSFLATGWRYHEGLVWVKDRMVLGHADYHYRHEPIMFGYTAGEGRRGRGGEGWYGDNSQVSVFEIPKPARSEEHPTMKPTALVIACLTNSCPGGGLVYDPFAGSGTTLIAAHSLGMRAAACEIDPRYADVILKRAETLTSIKPERVLPDGTTEPVTFQDQP